MGDSLSLIVFSIFCGIGGQLALKVGMDHVGRVSADALTQPLAMIGRLGTSPFVLGGLGLYGLGAVAWLTVLSRVPLSLAYPLLALSYAVTPVLAWVVLGETVSSIR